MSGDQGGSHKDTLRCCQPCGRHCIAAIVAAAAIAAAADATAAAIVDAARRIAKSSYRYSHPWGSLAIRLRKYRCTGIEPMYTPSTRTLRA